MEAKRKFILALSLMQRNGSSQSHVMQERGPLPGRGSVTHMPDRSPSPALRCGVTRREGLAPPPGRQAPWSQTAKAARRASSLSPLGQNSCPTYSSYPAAAIARQMPA